MRIRDHNKADLSLAALTLSVAAVAASNEVVRWARGRRRRNRPPVPGGPVDPKRPPRS